MLSPLPARAEGPSPEKAAVAAAQTDPLGEIRLLAEGGAPSLALARLEAAMPPRDQDTAEWLRWEKTRVALLRRLARTDEVVRELRRLQGTVDAGTEDWLLSQAIEALLEAGRPREARRLARRALWHRQDADAGHRRRWRAAVLRAWIGEGRLPEALATLLRLEQEDPAGGKQWADLHARILLQLERPDAAWSRLQENGAGETPLALIAGLRSGRLAAGDVLHRVKARLAKVEDPALAASLWRVRAEAERAGAALREAVLALEQVAVHQPSTEPALFDVRGDALWEAYLEFGQVLGNRLQLLRGKSKEWFAAAIERFEQAPVEARALLAVLAMSGGDPGQRTRAHEMLSERLLALEKGERLLRLLYLDAERFPQVETIPPPVRRRLVEIAVDRRDIPLASRLAAGLSAPEGDGDEAFRWDLLRARLLILGGQVSHGTNVLRERLSRLEAPRFGQIDRILQVAFDLQQIDEHERALELFNEIADLPLDARHRRELWYWIGESRAALGRHREAGEAFLFSAVHDGPHAMDPWAQTARYHAAVELEKAGLLRDALELLTGLRRATRDPARRMLIEHRMRRIRARMENPGRGGRESGAEG